MFPCVPKTLGSIALMGLAGKELMGLAATPGSTMFNVSALLATMLPVVPCVPTVVVPVPSALMPMPVLGNTAEISSSPIVGPEGDAAAFPIVIEVVGLPCASIPLVTTGTPRLIVRSGKLIASNMVVPSLSATDFKLRWTRGT